MTRRIHRGKGGGAREVRKNEGLRGLPIPFPDYGGHAGYIVKVKSVSSVPRFLPNLVVIAGIVLKRQPLQTFSTITVQVRIFTGLDRNELKQSFRISEIILSINAKVLFFVSLSCIRHLVCDTSFGHIRGLM